jgi:hypothetical protein
MMVLTLHNLAETYKMLPSEALDRASTFDLYVLDCHTRYVKYQQEREQAKSQGLPPPKQLSQDQMKAMIERVRSKQA